MNRMEELRQQIIDTLEGNIAEFEDGGNPELDGDFVTVDYVTAKRALELLKKLKAPVYAKWHYYVNDEGKARWKCTNCGKVIRQGQHEKLFCSTCGAIVTPES